LTSTAHDTATRIAIVGGAIAIVIEAVACLGGRIVVAIASDHAVRTRRRSSRANAALSGAARQSAARVAVVDGAIAIVIEAVARLGGRIVVAIADDCAARARRRSSGANALLASRANQAAAWIAIVGSAVAIVVEAVAGFRARRRILIAHDAATGTRRRACRTNA
jgi:hypothetical protein